MARMDGSTLSSALEIPLAVLSLVKHLTMGATSNVSAHVMKTMPVAPGHGFLFLPLLIVEELVISRGGRKRALRQIEMAWSVVPCPLPTDSRLHHRTCLQGMVAQLLEAEVSRLRLWDLYRSL